MKIGENGFSETQWRDPASWAAAVPDQPPGRIVAFGAVPPGFLLVQGFLDAATASRMVEACAAEEGVRITLGAHGANGVVAGHPVDRTSECIAAADVAGFDLTGLVRMIWRNTVSPYFGADIESFEAPEVLRYREGGEYRPHSDAESFITEEKRWTRSLDRDLSILLYLNDDFAGGEIVFHNFGMQLKPGRGLLIAFPADHRYVHAAMPVKTGVRYAVVSWAAVRGTPRVERTRRPAHIPL